MQLRSNATGQTDPSTLYEQAGATAGFDAAYDAGKMWNSTGLNLAQVAAGAPLAIQGLPQLSAAGVVPLTVQVPAAGAYSLLAPQLLNLPAGLQVFLVDNLTGQRLDVRTLPPAGYSFSVAAAQVLAGRFYLSLNAAAPLATAPGWQAAEVSVFPNPTHARFTVLVPAVAGAASVRAELLNSLGQRVYQQQATLPAAGAALQLDASGLATGLYVLRLQAAGHTLIKMLSVE